MDGWDDVGRATSRAVALTVGGLLAFGFVAGLGADALVRRHRRRVA